MWNGFQPPRHGIVAVKVAPLEVGQCPLRVYRVTAGRKPKLAFVRFAPLATDAPQQPSTYSITTGLPYRIFAAKPRSAAEALFCLSQQIAELARARRRLPV